MTNFSIRKKEWNLVRMEPNTLHLGVDQPKSIQLLYLDQACGEDFISNLTDDQSCSFRNGHKDLLDIRMNRG